MGEREERSRRGLMLVVIVLLAAVPFVVLTLTDTHDRLNDALTQAKATQDELDGALREIDDLKGDIEDQRARTDTIQARLELADGVVAQCQVGAGLLAGAARELLRENPSIFKVSRYTRLAKERLDRCFDYNATKDKSVSV